MSKPKNATSVSSILNKASASFALSDKAKDGLWLELEANDEPIGIAVLVRSENIKRVRKAREKSAGFFQKKSKTWQEKNGSKLLAELVANHYVTDWWCWDIETQDTPDFEKDSKPEDHEPYKASELEAFLAAQPELGENDSITQIREFAADSSNYQAVPDMGKSETTLEDV